MKLTPHMLIKAAEQLPDPWLVYKKVIGPVYHIPVYNFELITKEPPGHAVPMRYLVFKYDVTINNWVLTSIVDGPKTHELCTI